MLEIRKLNIADIPLLRELVFKVWPQTYASILSQDQIDYMLDLMYSEKALENQLQEGIQFVFVYDEQDPVGYASFQQTSPTIFKLHKIYILPSQQGKGTGKFLLQYIIDTIKRNGATVLQLQVNRNNKARLFYEKLGFMVTGAFDFDIGKGYLMQDYVMSLDLGENRED